MWRQPESEERRGRDVWTNANADKMAAVVKLTGEEEDGADASLNASESSVLTSDTKALERHNMADFFFILSTLRSAICTIFPPLDGFV